MYSGEIKGSFIRSKKSKCAIHDQWTNDGSKAHKTGEGALQFPLVIGWHVTRYNGLQRRAADAPQAVRYQKGKHHPPLCGKGKQDQSQGIERQTEIDALFIPDPRVYHPCQPTLYPSNQHSHYCQGNANHFFTPVKPVNGKVIPVPWQGRGAKIEQEEAKSQPADLRVPG